MNRYVTGLVSFLLLYTLQAAPRLDRLNLLQFRDGNGKAQSVRTVNTEATSLLWLVCAFWHLLRKISGLLKNYLDIIGAEAVRLQALYFGFCSCFLDGSSRRS